MSAKCDGSSAISLSASLRVSHRTRLVGSGTRGRRAGEEAGRAISAEQVAMTWGSA